MVPSPRSGDHDPYRVVDLALRAGEILLAAGASAAEVTDTCTAIAHAGGLRRVECDITFTSITVSGRTAAQDVPVSALRLVRHRELDYSRVTEVHNIVSELSEGWIRVSEADRRLLVLSAGRHPYPRAVVMTARALLAAAVALQLGAGLLVTVAAFWTTVVVDTAIRAMHRRGLPAFFQNAAGGLIATSVALGLVAADVGVRPALVVAGGIVLLLPGVALVGTVHEAITGFYVTASARAFETFLLTAGIISGVAVALSIGVRLGVPVEMWDPPTTGLADVPLKILAAAVASAAFAVAHHAPRRTVPAAAGAGAIGWAVFLGLDHIELSVTIASGTAAVVIGLGSYAFAHWQQVPALVYVAAGIIPLLPGLAIYRALRRLADGDTIGGIALLGTAITIGLALAAGTLLGEYLAQPLGRTGSARDRRLSGLLNATATRRRGAFSRSSALAAQVRVATTAQPL